MPAAAAESPAAESERPTQPTTRRCRVKKWAIAALTLGWLAWELVANFDHDPGTWPLTWVIVTYLPWWIYLPAAVILGAWIPFHFWQNWRRNPKHHKGMRE
jgi:hypothetical protein